MTPGGSPGPDGDPGSRPPELRARVRADCDNRPGVYRMLGSRGEAIYVGKSIRLRARLLSYFRASPGEKAAEILRATRGLEWTYLPDEFSALLTEMRMIRRDAPRYNVRHKGGRAVGFIRLTREPAPRLVAAARARRDGSVYFGPFPAPARVQRMLRELAHVLGLRDCAASTPIRFGDQLDLLDAERAPLCLRGELGSCLAPCAALCTAAEYQEGFEHARRFLAGDADEPIRMVEAAMGRAAARLDFEYAALLRDRAARLRRFQDELQGFRGEVDRLSFLYRVPGIEAGERVYLVHQGRVRLQEDWPRTRRQRARFRRKVEKRMQEPPSGPEDLTPLEADEILLVARWFRLRPEEWERTRPLSDLMHDPRWKERSEAGPSASPLPGRHGRALSRTGPGPR